MIPLFAIIITISLPIFVIIRNKKVPVRRPYIFSIGSFTFCTIGAIQELKTIKIRMVSSDIGGIEDTIGAVITICIILLVITVVLNFIALGVSYED